MAQKSLDLIEHGRRILADIHPTTVRGVAYQLFIRDLIENMGKPCVGKVAHLLVQAREKGIIPWEWIVDNTRQEEGVSTMRKEIMSRIDHEAWEHCKVVEAAEKESYGRYIKAWPGISDQDQKYSKPRDRGSAP